MAAIFDHPPRALAKRQTITIEVTPSELHRLVRTLEVEAVEAMAQGNDDYADFLLERIKQLREAGR